MHRILTTIIFFMAMALSARILAASLVDWKTVGLRDLPAIVEAVVFQDEVLDANHQFHYGNWIVRMRCQGKKPFVDYSIGGDGYKEWLSIGIHNLTCTNPVRGDMKCHLALLRSPGSGCFLTINPNMWKLDHCPTRLRLKWPYFSLR